MCPQKVFCLTFGVHIIHFEHPLYMRGIILPFSVFIRGEFKSSAAYNQLIRLKSKTDCQKTSFIVSLKNRKYELKSVSRLILSTI